MTIPSAGGRAFELMAEQQNARKCLGVLPAYKGPAQSTPGITKINTELDSPWVKAHLLAPKIHKKVLINPRSNMAVLQGNGRTLYKL